MILRGLHNHDRHLHSRAYAPTTSSRKSEEHSREFLDLVMKCADTNRCALSRFLILEEPMLKATYHVDAIGDFVEHDDALISQFSVDLATSCDGVVEKLRDIMSNGFLLLNTYKKLLAAPIISCSCCMS